KAFRLDRKPPATKGSDAKPARRELPKGPDFRPGSVEIELPKDPPAPAVPSPAPAPADATLKLPPLELPKEPTTKPKDPAAPAVPSPAPAPSDQLIPPSVPLVPGPGKTDALPSLTLPPEAPVKTDSTSRSSPLTGGRRDMTVSVFPAGGPEPAGVYR